MVFKTCGRRGKENTINIEAISRFKGCTSHTNIREREGGSATMSGYSNTLKIK